MVCHQRHFGMLFERDQPGAQTIIDIVIVVGDFIGKVGDLRFQRGAAVFQEPFAQLAQMLCVSRILPCLAMMGNRTELFRTELF